MAITKRNSRNSKPERPPETTPEARENQVIADAYGLAQRQIREGTASAQVITHFLKLGTEREKLEREKLRQENELAKARIDALRSQAGMEELYKKALEAMSTYSGHPEAHAAIEDSNLLEAAKHQRIPESLQLSQASR